MDNNSNMSKNRQNEYLGVNKIGKNIRKSPLHQPNFGNNGDNNKAIVGSSPARQPPQPQIYNISKNDFRSIVQQLTGSPSRNDPLPRPPSNPPKNPSMRMQRIRPPPLTPINRPPIPPVVVSQGPLLPRPQGVPMAPPRGQFDNGYGRPVPQFGQPSPRGMQPALSPISAYMQQLQSCIGEGGQRPGQQQMPGQVPAQHHMQPQGYGYMPAQPLNIQQGPGHGQAQPPMQPQVRGQFQVQQRMNLQGHGQVQGQFPMHPQGPGDVQAQPPIHPQGHGHVPAQPSMHPQGHGHVHPQRPSSGLLPNPSVQPLPSPGTNGPGLLRSPTSQFLLPSPGARGPGLLPSPTSQYPSPSPNGYFNLLSPTPRSPYPLLSPGSQFPPLSPTFAFSPFGQHGVLGPGSHPPPLSPGISFPSSPSGFFPMLSPRWRDQ